MRKCSKVQKGHNFENHLYSDSTKSFLWYVVNVIPKKHHAKEKKLLKRFWDWPILLLVVNFWYELGKMGKSRSIASQITNLASRKTYLVIILPNSYQKLTKSKIRSSWSGFEHCSKSLNLSSRKSYLVIISFFYLPKFTTKSYLVIICPNSSNKLTKSIHAGRHFFVIGLAIDLHVLLLLVKVWFWPELLMPSCPSLFHPIHIKSWPRVKSGQVGVGSNIAQNHSSHLHEVISGHYLPKFISKVDQNKN